MNRNSAANNGNGNSGDAPRPVQSIRFGQLEAAIWRNETDSGVFYNVTVKRHFVNDSGSWGESQSFGYEDLPTLAKLTNDCHSAIYRMKVRDAEEQSASEQQQGTQARGNNGNQRNRQTANSR